MRSDRVVNMAYNEEIGYTVAAIDMKLGMTRDVIPVVSDLTEHCDIIILCDIEYWNVHKHLEFLPWGWDSLQFSDDVRPADGWQHLSDVMLYKTSHNVMSMAWRELRRTPLERSLVPQGDLIWCPGLVEEDKYTRMGRANPGAWTKVEGALQQVFRTDANRLTSHRNWLQ